MSDTPSQISPSEEEQGLAPKEQTLLKSSIVMASGTLVSRGLGFVRSALLVAALGSSAGAMASFQVANTLPNMVYNLLAAGIIDAVLIPQIVRALKTKSGNEYVNKLLTAAGTLLFLLTIAAMVATPVIVTILASAFSPQMRALTITFALICVPQIFFYGLYNLLGELLNARGIFGPYMWAPVVNNVFGIASLILFLSLWGKAGDVRPAESMTAEQIVVVAGLSTLGVIAQALVLLIPMRKSGLKLRLDFRLRGTSFGSASKVAFWTFATLVLSQFAVVSTSQIATRADAYTEMTGTLVAGNPAYQYAFMIFMVPQSLIALTLATAIFTRLANDVSDGNIRGVAENYHRGVELIVLLSFYAAAVLTVAATPIMQIIMPALSTHSASLYGMVLVALVFALPSAGLSIMSQRVFFAFENARPVFLITIPPIILQVVVGWTVYFLADPQWWTVGAAAGETAYRVAQGFIALVWVGVVVRQINVGRIVVFYLRSLIAFALSAGAAWAVLHFIGPGSVADTTLGRFVDGTWKSILVALVVGVVYFGFLRLVDPSGTSQAVEALVARIRPRRPAPATLPAGEEIDSEDQLEEALAEETTKPDSQRDDDEDVDEDDFEGTASTEKVGRELPQAETWAESPPTWDDILSRAALEAESATFALNRSNSTPDLLSTGAIPLLPAQRSTPGKQVPAPGQPSVPIVVANQDANGEDAIAEDASRGNVEPVVSRKDLDVSSNNGQDRRILEVSSPRSGKFNPTVPAIVIGLVLLIVAGFWAFRSIAGSYPSELLSDIGISVDVTGQSSGDEDGAAEEDEDGAAEEEVTVKEQPSAGKPVITSATVFSWSDDDGDHPELVSAMLDHDPTTTWRSRYFTDNIFAEGSEIAILLSLSEPAVVSEITLNILGQGGEIVVRDASGGNPRAGDVLATATADGDTTIKLAQPTEMSAIGIVFSSLPVDDEGVNRAKIATVSVR